MRRALGAVFLLTWTGLAPAQVSYQIRAISYEFLPDTVHMQSGDTILFRPIGAHDMTEVDSLDWAVLQPIWNGGFATPTGIDTDFVVTAPGTHYFLCAAHASTGMRGVLIVDSAVTTGGPSLDQVRELQLSPNPAWDVTFLQLPEGRDIDRVEIIDAFGRIVRSQAVPLYDGRMSIPLDGLASGAYQLCARSKGRAIGAARLIVR